MGHFVAVATAWSEVLGEAVVTGSDRDNKSMGLDRAAEPAAGKPPGGGVTQPQRHLTPDGRKAYEAA